MSKLKATEGPWQASGWDGEWSVFKGNPAECQLAELNSRDMGIDLDAKANAHLIAAAPELYEALKSLSQTASRYLPEYEEHPEIQAAVEVLAKARGEYQ